MRFTLFGDPIRDYRDGGYYVYNNRKREYVPLDIFVEWHTAAGVQIVEFVSPHTFLSPEQARQALIEQLIRKLDESMRLPPAQDEAVNTPVTLVRAYRHLKGAGWPTDERVTPIFQPPINFLDRLTTGIRQVPPGELTAIFDAKNRKINIVRNLFPLPPVTLTESFNG